MLVPQLPLTDRGQAGVEQRGQHSLTELVTVTQCANLLASPGYPYTKPQA